MTISMRWARAEDSPIVGKFVYALLAELSDGKGPDEATVQGHAKALLDGQQVHACIAFEEETPVGVIVLNECAAIYAGGRFAEISELYVTPALRSRGVASQLIAKATEQATQRGWVRLEVGAPSQPQWQRSLAFYLREGFIETGPRLRKLM